MTTCVTGATGFIGRHLLERLSAHHSLRCLVRPTTPDTSGIEAAGAALVWGDVTDRDSVRAALAGCDRLVNLANVYSLWEPDRGVYQRVNVEGTRNVLECALEAGVTRAIQVSTVTAFGKPTAVPFDEETAAGPVRFSAYARSKYEGDLVAAEVRRRGLPLVTVYPAGVLGPGDNGPSGRYIADVARRRLPVAVFADSVVTWVHVRDVAEAIALILDAEALPGDRLILGKHQLSMGALSRMVAEITGVPLPKLRLPNRVALAVAGFLTAVSAVTRRPPSWGISLDAARTLNAGIRADGSRAESELGLEYTPLRRAVEETLAAVRDGDPTSLGAHTD